MVLLHQKIHEPKLENTNIHNYIFRVIFKGFIYHCEHSLSLKKTVKKKTEKNCGTISYFQNWKVPSLNSTDVLSQALGPSLVTGS